MMKAWTWENKQKVYSITRQYIDELEGKGFVVRTLDKIEFIRSLHRHGYIGQRTDAPRIAGKAGRSAAQWSSNQESPAFKHGSVNRRACEEKSEKVSDRG